MPNEHFHSRIFSEAHIDGRTDQSRHEIRRFIHLIVCPRSYQGETVKLKFKAFFTIDLLGYDLLTREPSKSPRELEIDELCDHFSLGATNLRLRSI